MSVNPRSQAFHGILLYRKDYGEHDMLIKFFTAEHGTKMFLVRGANKANFKMAGDVLPFTYGTYEGTIKQEGLSYISSGSDVKHFEQISEDIYLNAYATYIMSLVDKALPDGETNKLWFNKLFYALNLINGGADPEIVTNIVEIQLLPEFGVAPHFSSCVICGATNKRFDYSESYGGIICEDHFAKDPHRMHLDQRSVYFLRLFSTVNLKKIDNIQVNAQEKKKLRKVIDKIYENSVGLNLKSKKFLDQMNNWKIKLD